MCKNTLISVQPDGSEQKDSKLYSSIALHSVQAQHIQPETKVRFFVLYRKKRKKYTGAMWKKLLAIIETRTMGLVRITSWYPKFNGSHFGLPPSSIHKMTGLGGKMV